jgi:alpha-D-xyloside xylohydrolase
MKKHLSFALVIGVLAVTAVPARAVVVTSNELPAGAQYAIDGGTLRVQFWSPEIARITFTTGTNLPILESLSVIAKPETVALTREKDDQAFTLASSDIKVKIDRQTGAVTFLDPAGHVLLQETAQGREIKPHTVAGDAVTSCTQSFELSPDEGIYGLGQHQHDVWNYLTDGPVRLAQANTDVGIPVMTSSKGYMLLWNNPAVTTISSSPVEGSQDGRKLLHWSSECGKAIDYYFCSETAPSPPP